MMRRNPLESGQCFSLGLRRKIAEKASYKVAIPSNRVNVSHKMKAIIDAHFLPECQSQSPRIGSMFLTTETVSKEMKEGIEGRNPLESGQCFSRVRELKN